MPLCTMKIFRGNHDKNTARTKRQRTPKTKTTVRECYSCNLFRSSSELKMRLLLLNSITVLLWAAMLCAPATCSPAFEGESEQEAAERKATVRRRLIEEGKLLEDDLCVGDDGKLEECDVDKFPKCNSKKEEWCFNRTNLRDQFHRDKVPKYAIKYNRVLCYGLDWNCSLCSPGRFCFDKSERRCILDNRYPCPSWQ